ncbi:MAG: MMPL family transporter [Nocardioidaceae bacterium]
MESWGRIVGGHPWRVLLAALAVVVAAAGYAIGVFGPLSNGGFSDPGSESARVESAIRADFPRQAVDLVAVYSSPDLLVTDPAFRTSVEQALATVREELRIQTTTWYDDQQPSLVGNDGHATRVLITLPGDGEEARVDAFRRIKPLLHADGLDTAVGGMYAVYDDVDAQVSEDIARAESISMPFVFLLSLLIFGSLVAALMPTMVGGVAVVGAFAVVRLLTLVTDVSVFAINVITLMGMGLAIDYALFVVSRFREELGGESSREAVGAALERTMATAGRTVFFSGVIVAASLSSLLLFPMTFLRSMGLGGMAAVLVAMTASLTVLPAVLGVLGRRIDLGRIRRRRVGRHTAGRQRWAGIARAVMRRPVVFLVAISALLLVLGGPMLTARWGGVDETVLPASAPSRVAADLQTEWFGGEQSTAEIVVRGGSAADQAAFLSDLASTPGVDYVVPLTSRTIHGELSALVQAAWSGNSQLESSQQVVRDLREVAAPAGVTAEVGGSTADTVDLVHAIVSTLPWMGLLVAVVMFVLLFVAFGSLVLPAKAIVMNTVSIAASFGVVTWVFQDGHLSGPLGFTAQGYLDATQPILMLAVLFGLSMDYEVFLLSRIREDWDATGDNTQAVAAGLQHTGRIITSAALLLAVVIGGFATSGIVFIKMLGLGMLVAVLLDATIVRALLVPATMRLLGGLNWWAPGPLRRWWERWGHGRPAPAPEPASASEPAPVAVTGT